MFVLLLAAVASAQVGPGHFEKCSTNTPAVTTDDCACDSMFALELANDFGLTSCDADARIPCGTDMCTANEFQAKVYLNPLDETLTPSLAVPEQQTGENLEGRAAPICPDGSDSCSPQDYVRCVDGTRPIYWVDWADNGSDDWVFTFQGGGSCGRHTDFTGGEACWSYYNGIVRDFNPDGKRVRDDMTGWLLDANQTGTAAFIGPERFRTGEGIHADEAEHFSDYNRVYIPKCTFDRGNGLAYLTDGTRTCSGTNCIPHGPDPDTNARPGSGTGDSFNLAFTGRALITAILMDLDTPEEDDPDLSDAERILFAGHSGGAQGLVHNLDRMSAFTQLIAPDADIRGLLDARGWPTLNHIVAKEHPTDWLTLFDASSFRTMNCADCLSDRTFTTDDDPNWIPAGYSVGDTVPGDVSAVNYRSGSDVHIRALYHNTVFDASCMDIYPSRDPWRCRASDHVMWNHLSTPFFVRQAVEDSKHVVKRGLDYADDDGWRWTSPADYRYQTIWQIEDVQAWANDTTGTLTGPVEATDNYGWMAPGDPIGLGLFFPDSTRHPGIFSNAGFAEEMSHTAGGECHSYGDVLHRWIQGEGDTVFISPSLGGSTAADQTCN